MPLTGLNECVYCINSTINTGKKRSIIVLQYICETHILFYLACIICKPWILFIKFIVQLISEDNWKSHVKSIDQDVWQIVITWCLLNVVCVCSEWSCTGKLANLWASVLLVGGAWAVALATEKWCGASLLNTSWRTVQQDATAH